jgi:hypothetical protein
MRFVLGIILLLLPSLLMAQVRIKQSINTNWQFYKGTLDETQLKEPGHPMEDESACRTVTTHTMCWMMNPIITGVTRGTKK